MRFRLTPRSMALIDLKLLIRFVIAYLVADDNVKCETVAAMRDRRLHHYRPMASNSHDLNTVDYRICGVYTTVTCLSEIC